MLPIQSPPLHSVVASPFQFHSLSLSGINLNFCATQPTLTPRKRRRLLSDDDDDDDDEEPNYGEVPVQAIVSLAKTPKGKIRHRKSAKNIKIRKNDGRHQMSYRRRKRIKELAKLLIDEGHDVYLVIVGKRGNVSGVISESLNPLVNLADLLHRTRLMRSIKAKNTHPFSGGREEEDEQVARYNESCEKEKKRTKKIQKELRELFDSQCTD